MNTSRIIIGILGLSIMLFISCIDEGKVTYDQYVLLNGSTCSIEIFVYDRNTRSLESEIDLLNNGDSWESELIKTSEPGGNIEPPSYALGGDSLVVIYNDSAYVNFIFPDPGNVYAEYNILDYDNYFIENGFDSGRRLTYTFTSEDCELAYQK